LEVGFLTFLELEHEFGEDFLKFLEHDLGEDGAIGSPADLSVMP
jgi:hypothetical protein